MNKLSGNIETYRGGYNITIGGGITTERIMQVLRLTYLGGIKADERISKLITCGGGPTEFMSVERSHVKIDASHRITFADILKEDRHSALTYEVALRWLITAPNEHFHRQSHRDIIVFSPAPLIIDGKPHGMFLREGPDSPMIHFFPIWLTCKFPLECDFLEAHRIGYGNPFCS